MSWYGYEQAAGASLTRPWWRGVPPGRFISVGPGTEGIYQRHWYRGDQYEIRELTVGVDYQGFDPTGLIVGPSSASSDGAETDIDILVPLPVPDPIVGQIWVINDGGVRRDLMLTRIDYPAGIANVWFGTDYQEVGMGSAHDHMQEMPYVVGVNWPPPDAVLVAGQGSPWSPIPLPVIP